MGQDLGKLLLRIAVGGMLLLHGIAKLRHGLGGLDKTVVDHGLPHAVAYLVYVGEVVAPLMVLLGLATRPAALIISINMAMAVWLAHSGSLLQLGHGGGYALELQAFYFLGGLIIALIGTGRYALMGGASRWS
jgi:putative oxidoreductase